MFGFFNWFSWWDVAMLLLFLFTLFMIYGYWAVGGLKRKGIKCLPAYPIVGHSADSLLKRAHFVDNLLQSYRAFPGEKYTGFYQFLKPNLMIKDIDVIKTIAIKDFDHFQDRQNIAGDTDEALISKSLVALHGQKWRDMRSTLSPAFTSSKMRNMYTLIDECAEHMCKYFQGLMKEYSYRDTGHVEIEMKDTFTRYTNDVIATCSFGMKVDSFSDKTNSFYMMGKKVTNFDGWLVFRMFFMFSFPAVAKAFKVQLFDASITNFFRSLVNGEIMRREKNNILRPDMIQLLMEAKKGTLKHETSNEINKEFASVDEVLKEEKPLKKKWDDDEIVAQALLFFFAGFDTSSTLLTFMAHELTLNPEIQKKLQNEIDETTERCNGKVGYDDIQRMEYMDMVVSETLRRWPPGAITDRVCTKPYTLPPSSPGSDSYKVEIGDNIWIPVYGIHHDPKYYDNPHDFDPERFSSENKAKIKPFTYLPFGIGPRNCIGSRFALMEVKSVMLHLLSNFDFVPTSKTTNPLVLDKNTPLQLVSKGKSWLGLKPRKK